MKKIIFLISFLTLALGVFAQDVTDEKLSPDVAIPPNIKLPAGVDIKDVKSEDITEENLKLSGATDEQIKQALEYKKNIENQSGTESISGDIENDKVKQIAGEEQKEETKQNVKEEELEGTVIQIPARKFPPALIYGHSFFRSNQIGIYNKAADIKAPDNYTLGVGDEINISIWGYSDFNSVFQIDEFGAIQPQLVGRVYLKGMEFGKAKSMLKARFGQVYDLNNSQFDVVLAYSRIISINIVGEVFYPGTYTLPAMNSAFNLLVDVGGPTDLGSVRKIYIKRNGEVIKILDIYKYLLDPNADQDFFLENNDFIFVPPRGKVIKINGEVNRANSYELLENENLIALIKYSGSFNPTAFKEIIQIKRYEENKKEILIDLNFNQLIKDKKDFLLQDGDEITIRRLQDGLSNIVEVQGAVKMAGFYEFSEGMTISDLIKKAQGLRQDAYIDESYLVRVKDDLFKENIKFDLKKAIEDTGNTFNLLLKNNDLIIIISKEAFVDKFTVGLDGAVRNEGRFSYTEGMSLKQLILRGGGLSKNAYLKRAYITRLHDDYTYQYIPVELDTSNNMEQLEKILLKSHDFVRIYSNKYYVDQFNVSVIGLVRNPDNYKFYDGMTLADALMLSGGFKTEADVNRIEISRLVDFENSVKNSNPTKTDAVTLQISYDINKDKAANEFKLKPYDQIFVRQTPEFELPKNITIKGEVKYPGVYTLISRNEKLASVIKRAGGLTEFAFHKGATLFRKEKNIGYVFLNLKKAINHKRSKVNYVLKEGDEIIIPRLVDLVHIKGEIDYPIDNTVSSPFHRFKRAKFYVTNYGGGFNKKAKKRFTYVLWPNGIKRNTHNFGFFNVFPRVKKGSTVYVATKPEKVKKEKVEKVPVDWNKVIESTTTKLIGILSIMVLADAALNK